MKFKRGELSMDESTMCQLLFESFRLYGYTLHQSLSLPTALKPLVDNNEVVITLKLNKDHTLTLMPYDTAKIKTLQKTVKDQTKEIESLKKEAKKTAPETIEEAIATDNFKIVEAKPFEEHKEMVQVTTLPEPKKTRKSRRKQT